MSQTDHDAGTKAATPRKPYSAPKLTSYGHVKDIIQGGGGRKSDAFGTPPGGNSKKACWIAETLYGADDPRTLLVRAWLGVVYEERRPGWAFVALYRQFGEATATLIARGYLPRRLFQWGFDALVEKALDASALALAAARR